MSEELHVDNVSISAEPQLHKSTQWAMKALDEREWKYDVAPHTEERPSDRITLSFRADNMPGIRIYLFFHPDCRRVAMYVYDIIKLPKATKEELFNLIQTMHENYIFGRWVFFEKDSTLQVEWYAHMDDNIESARLVAAGVSRMAALVDEAHPTLMKTCAELGLFK